MTPLKIAIVVHGRFHAFDLARELLKQGHRVVLFTNYPTWAVTLFKVPSFAVKSFWLHGILFRIFWWCHQQMKTPYPEKWLHLTFGRWATSALMKERWDIIHAWSGISEEVLQKLKDKKTAIFLMRGSSHIKTQSRLLEEEEKRAGTKLERPTVWMIEREEREYAFTENIIVLSRFAYESFLKEGVPSQKLNILQLGADLGAFRPTQNIVEERRQRILKGAPLRVLYVGALSFRKGFLDLFEIIQVLKKERFQFRLVGAISPEVSFLLKRLHNQVEIIPKQPQEKLPLAYAWADIFIFPTIEDGYAIVLAQAAASGLPVLSTSNCGAPDFICEGVSGWILPIRHPKLFTERLQRCESHRQELAEMVVRIPLKFKPRDWANVAIDFEKICRHHQKNQ